MVADEQACLLVPGVDGHYAVDEPHFLRIQRRKLSRGSGHGYTYLAQPRVQGNYLRIPDADLKALFGGGATADDRDVEVKMGAWACDKFEDFTVRSRKPGQDKFLAVRDRKVREKAWNQFVAIRREDEKNGKPWEDGLRAKDLKPA